MGTYAETMGPAPCPMCGLTDVRWRERRWYDVARTWLRLAAEQVLRAVGFGSTYAQTPGGRVSEYYRDPEHPFGISNDVAEDVLKENVYGLHREVWEAEVGSQTAARYWRCKTCRRKGQVFENLGALPGERRDQLLGMEDDLIGRGGGMGELLDRRGPRRD